MDFEDIMLSEMFDAKNKFCMITPYEAFSQIHRVRKGNEGATAGGGIEDSALVLSGDRVSEEVLAASWQQLYSTGNVLHAVEMYVCVHSCSVVCDSLWARGL